jgi:hypothetical protein
MGTIEEPPTEDLPVTGNEPQAAPKPGWRRTRKFVTGILVVLTALSVLTGTIAVWVHVTVFDTDRFVALVAPALEDRAVTDAMANELTTQIFRSLDVQDRVSSLLPGPLDRLAAPLVTASQEFVLRKVQEVFRSPQIHDLLLQLVAEAHDKAVLLLRKEYDQLPNVVVQNGQVSLNLIPLAAQVIRQVAQGGANLLGFSGTIPTILPDDPTQAIQALSQALGLNLPPDFGQVPLMSTAELEPLQDAVTKFDQLYIFAIILPFLLLGLALLVSRNRRRTLFQAAIAAVVALLIAGVAIRRIRVAVVDHISQPGARSATNDVLDEVLSSLRALTRWIVVIAIVVAIVAYLSGRPKWFMSFLAWGKSITARHPTGGQVERWVGTHADGMLIGGIALGVVVLLIIGVGIISFLVVGALVALYAWGVSAARHRVEHGPPGGAAAAGPAA